MIRGIVGASTSRKLDVSEFRGFVLSDDIAPVVFVNAADTKAAQIFTLVHEICHLWLDQSGLDDLSGNSESSYANERWCSRVAAEVLVPTLLFERTYRNSVALEELQRMAREFKVSTLVVSKRVYEAGKAECDEFDARYREEKLRLVELLERQPKPSGGDFCKTHPLRVSREFARALIRDTKTGRTLQGYAYRLLGTKKFSTFVNLAKELGVG